MEFFLSQTALAVLSLYFLNPKSKHHLRDLAQKIKVDAGNLSREMKTLVSAGYFQTEELGRLKFFTLNTQHPFYKELKGIVLKTAGVEAQIRAALRTVHNIERAFIYGSFASQKQDAASDIDVMLVGQASTLEVANTLRPLEKKLGREIHFRLVTRQEFDEKVKKRDVFYTNILSKKIIEL